MTRRPELGSGARTTRLTLNVIAHVPPHDAAAGLVSTCTDRPTDAVCDAAAAAASLQDRRHSAKVSVFAHGSLIWNPSFAFVEECLGTLPSALAGSASTPRTARHHATAAGKRGSMAEYLHSSVTHLEQCGIHDCYLWRLHQLVADKLAIQS